MAKHTYASGRSRNGCTSAVLSFFGIAAHTYRYAEGQRTVKGVLRRNGWSVRSRASSVSLKVGVTTIGALRRKLLKSDGGRANYFYVGVVGHAMVLNGRGETVVDTNPKRRDRRRVCHISSIARPCHRS